MSAKENEVKVLQFDSNKIVVFTEFEKELAILEEENKSLVFDYNDKQGNKDARSHVAEIRKCKKRATDIHRDSKAEALAYGRSLDSVKNALHEKIEEMIDVHDIPLREIKEKQEARVQAHENVLQVLRDGATVLTSNLNSAEIQKFIYAINSVKIDESLEEFQGEADKLKVYALSVLKTALDKAVEYEAEQAELTKFREENEAREKQEREDKIAEDAAKAATEASEKRIKEQEEQIEYNRKAAHQAVIDSINAFRYFGSGCDLGVYINELNKVLAITVDASLQEFEQQASDDKKEAITRLEVYIAERQEYDRVTAENRKIVADRKAKQELAYKEKQEQAEADKREANKKHHAKINNQSVDALVKAGISKEDAVTVVKAIAMKEIPNIKISY